MGRRESRHKEEGFVCGVWGGQWGREIAWALGPALRGARCSILTCVVGEDSQKPGFHLRVILKSALLLRDRRWAWSEDKVAKETKPQIPLFFLGMLDGRAKKFSDSWKERLSCVCFKQTDVLSKTQLSQCPG